MFAIQGEESQLSSWPKQFVKGFIDSLTNRPEFGLWLTPLMLLGSETSLIRGVWFAHTVPKLRSHRADNPYGCALCHGSWLSQNAQAHVEREADRNRCSSEAQGFSVVDSVGFLFVPVVCGPIDPRRVTYQSRRQTQRGAILRIAPLVPMISFAYGR